MKKILISTASSFLFLNIYLVIYGINQPEFIAFYQGSNLLESIVKFVEFSIVWGLPNFGGALCLVTFIMIFIMFFIELLFKKMFLGISKRIKGEFY